jgi:hypothetical protein
MSLDIYDDLEHLVPAERRDAFLRLSRQIKEYGDHNPELLRLVEVMGFLSLYTNDLPKRIAVEIDRGLAASQATNTACADMRAATTQLCTQLTTLQNTVDSAKAVAEHLALALADADKIKAAIEDNAKTAQAITSAASTISRRLAAIRRWDLLVIAGLGLLYFIGGAWFVWNDHRAVQNTIYQQVTLHTKDGLERLQSEYIKEHLGSLKAFVNTGVTVSVVHDSEGDTTLYFQGRPGVSLFKPRYSSGKYAISVLQ